MEALIAPAPVDCYDCLRFRGTIECEHGDCRAIFVMPFRGQLMVGTTEVRYHGDPSTVAPGPHEVHYLLGVLRHYFPRFRDAAASELRGEFAGLRVLPAGGGHAFHRSRSTPCITWLFPDSSGAWSRCRS